ncbi:hypothetical protein ThrDRAFT_03150 [Frankia casuarinae]|nr:MULTISPECIES: hypothetical protein [Frankia]ETA00829.1 hypothetical protein CcI6DRAFT_03770 [Frankia sp. CcI6]EYT91223.1 hypothetical protein ThrDRAFT_03150 [Frankia casuarinae]KFB03383.1 hypothetical protein ALLO2DRAFT_03887 [Frankia sp. Allo2]OAA21475.1 hypothetical protein AAY23_107614 [Frankia casuarinae]OHV51943.1 hypothetical protein CgIS1_17920 [Frankia sp. CgIS1]
MTSITVVVHPGQLDGVEAGAVQPADAVDPGEHLSRCLVEVRALGPVVHRRRGEVVVLRVADDLSVTRGQDPREQGEVGLPAP